MKKTFLPLLLVIFILLMLTACSEHGNDNSYDLTIASCGGAGYTSELHFVIEEFEKEYGWNINIIDYDIEKDYYALQTKVMAKDKDIDIVYSPTLDIFNLINSKYYEDLSKYEGLKSRIEGNEFTKYACSYNGEYFGVSVFPQISVDYPFTISLTIDKYMFYNLNLIEGIYGDPEGKELFEVLKHYYQYPEDPIDTPYYSEDCDYIGSEYLVINPYSKNKDNAIEFLEKTFDYINGDIEYTDEKGNVYTARNPYPEVDNLDGIYLYWMHNDSDNITKLIGDALNSALKSDGSDETLRKLAKEAAQEVKMRMEG